MANNVDLAHYEVILHFCLHKPPCSNFHSPLLSICAPADPPLLILLRIADFTAHISIEPFFFSSLEPLLELLARY